jgi:hypothetical protein
MPTQENSVLYNVGWAIKLFKPLLGKIDYNKVPLNPNRQFIYLKDWRRYQIMNLSRFVVTVCRKDTGYEGDATFIFSEVRTKDGYLYFLQINLDEKTFEKSNKSNIGFKIRRHRALIHEFTHCIAYFLSIRRILTRAIINRLKKKLQSDVEMNYLTHYRDILLRSTGQTLSQDAKLGIYPDRHFRTGYEDFEGDYRSLYKNLILDKTKFDKHFEPKMQKEFFKKVKEGKLQEANAILNAIIAKVHIHESISKEFIRLHLGEELLKQY